MRLWLDVGCAYREAAFRPGTEFATLRELLTLHLPELLYCRRLADGRFIAVEPEAVIQQLDAPEQQHGVATHWLRRARRLAGQILGRSEHMAAPIDDAGPTIGFTAGDVLIRTVDDHRTDATENSSDPSQAAAAKVLLLPETSDAGPRAAGALLRDAFILALDGLAPFEDRLQHLYTQLLRAGDHCIDIGAHTGRHVLPMSRAVGTGGHVSAFEPSPAIAARLRERLAALAIDQVRVHETALSDESGEAEFVLAVDLPEESGLRARTIYNGPTRTEKIVVALTRLDDLADRLGGGAPRFIKLDTEGAELKVLRGALTTLVRARPVVAFEFGAASYAAYDVDPNEVFDLFAALDYRIFSILGDALERGSFAEASRVQAYWDYVACDAAVARQVEDTLRSFQPG